MRVSTFIVALLPALALCTIFTSNEIETSGGVPSKGAIRDKDYVIEYRPEDAILSFKLPSEKNWDQSGRPIPSVEDETFLLNVLPHIDPASPESGLTLNGSMLIPEFQTRFSPALHGTEAIDLLYTEGSPLNRILGSWEVQNTCLHFVKVQDDCDEDDRTRTIVFEMHNPQNFPLAGLTATYKLGDRPEIIRFSPFFDLAALFDPENSRHWNSPLLSAGSNTPELGMADAPMVLSDPVSSMHTTYMRFAPTPIRSSIPRATSTGTSTTLSSTTSAPTAKSTSRTAPSIQNSSDPVSQPPIKNVPFQDPIARTFQKVLTFAKTLNPCKGILDSKPQKLSDLRLPKHVQISLAAIRPSPINDPPSPPSPSSPTSTSDPRPESTHTISSPHFRAFKYATIIFILVCISCHIFSQFIGDPRRRVDRAASREERRNRRLYRHAAKKHHWRQFWARVGQRIGEKLEGRACAERWRRGSSDAVEGGLYREPGLQGGSSHPSEEIFDEKGFRFEARRGPVVEQAATAGQPGPADLANEISSLRYTYAAVDRMVRAEEGHAGSSGNPIPFHPFHHHHHHHKLPPPPLHHVPRVMHARRWSSASKTGSDVTAPPPYDEIDDDDDLGLGLVDLRSEGTGKSVNTDDTPDSSVVGTSPRASLFARERDRESGSGSGSDSEFGKD